MAGNHYISLCEYYKREIVIPNFSLHVTFTSDFLIGAACWESYREGQISSLDRMKKKAAKFAHHATSPNWENLASRRKLSRICALFKAHSGERAWKAIGDRLQRPHYLSRVDHGRKVRSKMQRMGVEKYSFVKRTI
jgi:hypothetical protein